ncbi:MAG TPA: hypothetical protein VFZ16_11435 [Hyphomicrobiaceae bacterium]|nr:hypothetical protein [Hyphomicrobiaceae bacterium]
MDFNILGDIEQVETIAKGTGVRDRARLRKMYGSGRWLKRKGVARVRLNASRAVRLVELHWYEASGIGRVEFKIKRLL